MAEPRPSKSAQKRAALAIRAIADELVALKPAQLAQVVGDEDVLRAVREAQSIGSHGALRRQKQYIAKRLREVDIEPLRAALDALVGDPIAEKKRFRQAEQLRDALLGPDTPTAMIAAQTAGVTTDGAIASLVADFHSASDDAKRKATAKKLFRALHEQLLTVRIQTDTRRDTQAPPS